MYSWAMPPLLEAKELTKHYGATIALESVNFQVDQGITGLLGPNGAGKSTAIKLFLGLLKPTSGSAEVMGQKPYELVESRERLGYMPEHDCLPTAMTSSEFLTHMAQVSGLPPAHARTRAADVLRHVGLVLLDEPTAGLDPGGREEMLALIRRISRDFGISILLSSHLMGDVESVCDRIVVLEGGHVIEEGAVSRFTQETQTLFIDVDENRDELIEALAKRGIEATVDGPSLVVNRESDEQYDAIRDALVEADAPLRRMAPGRHGLTDIFRKTPT